MNDTDWFTEMYRRHHDDVERYVRRRAPDVEIADVVATVFMTAWRRIGDLPRTAPLPWLYTVANKTLANEVRSRRRQRCLDAKVRQVLLPENTADHSGHVADRMLVHRLLEHLPAEDLTIVRLIAWDGLSVSDTARAVGRSRTAVTMRIQRLRRWLAPVPGTEVLRTPSGTTVRATHATPRPIHVGRTG